ncbi:MAG: T9SS type A sorting domain-containing protein [Saprospiraceae bacterium]|nr:T9SS type A sorting domain-containing protein [Saprospiraceae bacterium]
MKSLIRTILFTLLFCVSSGVSHGQDCVSAFFDSFKDGDDLVVQLKVDNFDNILVSQFAFTYSYENLVLENITGNGVIDLNESHVFADIPGYISVSWSNASVGQTLPNGSVLLEMKFSEFTTSASDFAVDPNFEIEFIDAFFDEVCFTSTPLTINENRTQLIGKLFHDLNGNCIEDPSDLPLSGWTIFIDGGLDKFYRVTDEFGFYRIPVEIGSYTIEVLPKNELWTTCSGPELVIVEGNGEVIENSFVVAPSNSSSALEVTISSSEIRRCFDNVYSVKYKNNGTAVAQATTIIVKFDDNLDYVSTNTGNFSVNGNTILFNIGNVKPGDGGDFLIVLNADCDNLVAGQTLCVDAEITSSDIVIPPIGWGGAILTTKATCEEDSVAFTIQNIGASAMTVPLQSIVIEEDVMFGINEVDLEPLELMKFKHAASGGVYRVLIDQEDGYPLGQFSTDFVEFCNGGDTDTYQYVAMFQNEDESPYFDIECQEVQDELLENSLSAFPIGYRAEHLINQNEDIEYTVYFQNTSEDTIFNLYVETEIDASLNVESLIAGSSSHGYTVSIIDKQKFRIDFRNIQLPPSGINSFASTGFFKYRISQNLDVALGTIINSTATLFFDNGTTVITNTVDHQVGEEFIEIVLNNEEIVLDNELVLGPNPAISSMRVELSEKYKDISYILYDSNGRIMSAANSPTNVFYIQREFLRGGIYILEIRSSTKVLGTKKIVFLDR